MDTMRGAAIDGCTRLAYARNASVITGRPPWENGHARHRAPRALPIRMQHTNTKSMICHASTSEVQQAVETLPSTVAPKAVLFDMDGVLVNSEDLSRECVVTSTPQIDA